MNKTRKGQLTQQYAIDQLERMFSAVDRPAQYVAGWFKKPHIGGLKAQRGSKFRGVYQVEVGPEGHLYVLVDDSGLPVYGLGPKS